MSDNIINTKPFKVETGLLGKFWNRCRKNKDGYPNG